jgi:hypothetical protein
MRTRLLTPLLLLAFGAATPSITSAAPASPAAMVAAGGHSHRARHHAPPRATKHPKKVEHPKKKN